MTYSGNRDPSEGQLSLELAEQPHGRALTNERGREVGPALDRILTTAPSSDGRRRSPQRIVCTGFSSIGFLTDKSTTLARASDLGPVDIVLGWEDLAEDAFAKAGRIYGSIEDSVRDYWLKRGVAARQYPGVLRLMHLVESGAVHFSLLHRMHAKLYVGPEEALLGSSNFSRAGTQAQLEGNLIHRRGIDQSYEEVYELAMRYRDRSMSASDVILDLLRRLVRLVGWQEVLAKAASTVLDAEWVSDFEGLVLASREAKLWPSQRQTVAQALYILENNDCVLVADPTGSGKTRALSALHTAHVLRNWHTEIPGRQRAAVLTPPSVEQTWRREFRRYHVQIAPETVSHGLLSNPSTKDSRERVDRALEESQILYIDEAHNLYNDSNRSRRVHASPATRRVLATATPVSRSLDDIRPLIDLLDPNNLPDAVIALFDSLRRWAALSALEPADKEVLTRAISAVTVRHTIPGLNAMIDAAPAEYTDDAGARCRYPDTVHHVYKLDETAEDRRIAREIESITDELVGLAGLPRDARKLEWRSYWGLDLPETLPQSAVAGRINALGGLARFNVKAAVRSSVARLIELIEGRLRAASEFDLSFSRDLRSTDTGGSSVIDAMNRWREAGLPTVNKEVASLVPAWLQDPDQFAEVIDAEEARYREIAELARGLSPARLESRADEMSRLLEAYDKVLVFDDSIVTLSLLHRVATERILPAKRLFDSESSEKLAESLFGIDSDHDAAIGLCSPRLSEGVNLQGAQALMFSHIPSVYRHAEQRIGRIVRMNSRYKQVHVSWPEDAPEFRLSTDWRVHQTASDVEEVLGANLKFPLHLKGVRVEQHYTGKSASETFDALRREAESNQEIHDAFDPLRRLVTGDEALVDPEIYESIRGTSAHVAAPLRTARVGTVSAVAPFVFATVARERRAPEFYFWSQGMDEVLSRDLSEIANRLRAAVGDGEDPSDRELAFEQAGPIIEEAFRRFQAKRRSLLPNRHRRALQTFSKLSAWLQKHRKSMAADRGAIARLIEIAEVVHSGRYRDHDINLRRLAEALIEHVFEPLRRETIRSTKRRRHIITYDRALPTLKRAILQEGMAFPTEELLASLESSIEREESIESRTVALLVGVSGGEDR